MILYRKDNYVYFNHNSQVAWLHNQKVDFAALGPNSIRVNGVMNTGVKLVFEGDCAEILDYDGLPYGTTPEEVVLGFNKGFDTNWQDQTTPPVLAKFNQVHSSTTLNGAVAIDTYTITLTDVTGFVAGTHVVMFDPGSERFSQFTQIGAPVGNVITLDTPLDFAYPSGTFVDGAITDMAVNGAITPQIFGLRGTGAPPGVDLKFDLTRIIITVLCVNAPEYDEYGDLPSLLNGVVMRIRNGDYFNIFNVKTNGEWAGLMYDLAAVDRVNPNQGQNGWTGRLTFAGPSKIGVAIRLPVGEDVEFIIQDDLSGLDLFEITAEGHIVEETP